MALPPTPLTEQDVELLRKEFDARPVNRLLQNAVTTSPITKATVDTTSK